MQAMPKPPFERTLFVCCNEREPGEAACANRGSTSIHQKLKALVKEKGLKGRVRVVRSGCLDLCSVGPNLCIQPDNVWLNHVTENDLPRIIADWIDPLVPKSPAP